MATPDRNRRRERAALYRALLLAALLLVLVLPGGPPATAAELVNGILLRVNDRIATVYDYQRLLAQRRRLIESSPEIPPEERPRLLTEAPIAVLGELFDELLIQSRADQLSVEITDFELDEAIAGMRQERGLADDRRFADALAQAGMTVDDLRLQFRREQSRMGVVSREVRPRVTVTEEDVRRIYTENEDLYRVPEQVNVSELVVLEGAGAAELAAAVHAQLAAGKTLEAVGAEHGERLSSLLDVGWVAEADLDPALARAVFALEPGQYTQPTGGRGGLHIALAKERRPASVRPLEEVKEQIHRREFGRLMQVEYEKYLREQEKVAYIYCRTIAGTEGFCGQKVKAQRRALLPSGDRLGLEDIDNLFAPPAAPPPEGENPD